MDELEAQAALWESRPADEVMENHVRTVNEALLNIGAEYTNIVDGVEEEKQVLRPKPKEEEGLRFYYHLQLELGSRKYRAELEFKDEEIDRLERHVRFANEMVAKWQDAAVDLMAKAAEREKADASKISQLTARIAQLEEERKRKKRVIKTEILNALNRNMSDDDDETAVIKEQDAPAI